MTAPALLDGFSVTPADAFWVRCERCGDTEIFAGPYLADRATTWMQAHRLKHPERPKTEAAS